MSITCSPGLAAGQQRGELRALVLDFDLAFAKQRLGMDRGVAGVGSKPDAKPDRRPPGRLDVEVRELRYQLLAVGLERIDPQIERRAACQRRALGAAFVAERAGKIRIEPFGIFALDVRRRVGKRCGPERRFLLFGQRLGRKARAAAQRFDGRDIETALALQHADERRARGHLAHEPG